MHGDCTFENIGMDKYSKEYIIYDFGNAGSGIKNWDLAYFIGSAPIEVGEYLYKL